ncbi:SIMPL domain-containing protein [Fastidiosibacter lacustris]|uniref:SIMPL domain-containing protein n=1 Tax=Fastidiosibacter lacustris TaxID=2056695 RepID=UPI000E34F16C|nr:SIMPL domain-containing protein [Fastidiosibacter lacustris]
MSMRKSNFFGYFAIGIGVALSGAFIAYGILNFHSFNRYVGVKGLAEQTVKANKAIWNISYSVNANTLKEVYQKIEHDQLVIKNFITAAGLSIDSLQYGSISLNQNTHNKDQVNTSNYSAYSSMTIITDQVDVIVKFVQKTSDLVAKGVVISNSNVSYKYTLLNEIKPTMLEEATENAKTAALQFAKNAQTQLGSIRQATQGAFTIANQDASYGDGDPYKLVRVVVNAEYFLD